MENLISKSEYKILKTFMEHEKISTEKFDELYPSKSEIRISAIRLNYIKMIERVPIIKNNIIIGYEDNYKISPDGRFAYKHYKDNARKELNRLLIDKAIPFCALIISVLALLKSYGYGIDDIIHWCMQVLKQ